MLNCDEPLSSTLIRSEIDLLISYLEFISHDEHKDTYIDLLNAYIENPTIKKKINTFLWENSVLLPICRGKHIYLKNALLENIYIDRNDNYKYCFI